MIKTSIFVSTDNVNFTKLDLDKTESIPMKYVQKDTSDLSKVFSPYSQSFSYSATPNNQRALGYWGNTEVLKPSSSKLLYCKVYANELLSFVGFLKVTDLSYKNGKADMYTSNLTTLMGSLKDRIGDDLVSDLSDTANSILWTENFVNQYLTTVKNTNNINYFVPLISTNRVWAFDPTGDEGYLDNVAFASGINPNSDKTIKSDELRPCVDFASVMRLIKSKYDLDIIEPFVNENEYKDLFIWCNGENFYTLESKKFNILTNLGNRRRYNDNADFSPKKYAATSSTTDSSIKVVRESDASLWESFFTLRLNFDDVTFTGGTSKGLQVSLVKKSNGVEFANGSFTANEDNSFQCDVLVYDSYFVNDEIEFFIYIKFEQPTTWLNSEFRIIYKGRQELSIGTFKATYEYRSQVNNNSSSMNNAQVDLIKSLPEMKVIDFLTSYFKTFNVSIFESEPDSDKLYWLNPTDVNSSNNVYSKATVDYTPYVDLSSVKKSVSNDYNYYNFKHADSEYNSNVNYKIGSGGVAYGQLTYPEIKPTKANEYKIETNFSIIPPIILPGTSDIVTYYGFTADYPDILETGGKRYTPNTKELTLFYNHGLKSIATQPLAYQLKTAAGASSASRLNSYVKVLPWCQSSHQSLSFSILVFQNIQYPINLFSKYYQEQTIRYLDINSLKQEFDLILPISELYLNEESTIQGFGNVPKGFRLQNDIIIGETKFTIIDATIDRVSGKAKLTLLNYT